MTDEGGQVVWTGCYNAWGYLKEESNAAASVYQPFRLQSQYCDRETGLHYNFFRYYEPECGRFISQDPIRLAGGMNLYTFAPNAQGWIDPFGLKSIFEKNGLTFHAYPKGNGSNESAMHGPHGNYHFHLNGESGKVVVVDKDFNIKPEDPSKFTRAELNTLNPLNERERRYLRKACREVFHNNGSEDVLKSLKLRYLNFFGPLIMLFTDNSHTRTCEIDIANSTEVCD